MCSAWFCFFLLFISHFSSIFYCVHASSLNSNVYNLIPTIELPHILYLLHSLYFLSQSKKKFVKTRAWEQKLVYIYIDGHKMTEWQQRIQMKSKVRPREIYIFKLFALVSLKMGGQILRLIFPFFDIALCRMMKKEMAFTFAVCSRHFAQTMS